MAKGQKYSNPADKARKEARKKELKKNKKQREQVRSAAIKGRDPEQILAELENLDKLEYDPKNCEQQQTPSTNNVELIYKDKRKRLKELLQRILTHYQKEEPGRYEELKKLELEYETKHKNCEKEFAAIKAAKEVKIDEVFLPPETKQNSSELDDEITDDDLLMSESIYITPLTEGVTPPGCPQGPPPDLKCLVESLKDNYSLASMLPNNRILPPTFAPASKNMERYFSPMKQRSNQPPKKTSQLHKIYSKTMAESSQQSRQSKSVETIKKAAVIESKPVLFVPKATKFVPASVRSKMTLRPDTLKKK